MNKINLRTTFSLNRQYFNMELFETVKNTIKSKIKEKIRNNVYTPGLMHVQLLHYTWPKRIFTIFNCTRLAFVFKRHIYTYSPETEITT